MMEERAFYVHMDGESFYYTRNCGTMKGTGLDYLVDPLQRRTYIVVICVTFWKGY